jgi:hypothetical protein
MSDDNRLEVQNARHGHIAETVTLTDIVEGIRAITPEELAHLEEWFKTIKQRGALLALAQEKEPAAFGYRGTLNKKQIAMLAAPFAVSELTERDAAAKREYEKEIERIRGTQREELEHLRAEHEAVIESMRGRNATRGKITAGVFLIVGAVIGAMWPR